MHPRLLLLTLLSVLASMGAQYRTPNFMVNAPNPQVAQQVGQEAERYRREKALQWLGYEMPTWHQPCPLDVIVSLEPPQGKTSFTYQNDQVVSMRMEIQGRYDRLLNSVLPHEITHTVFAHYFRCAVPRWADEGGSVLSEDGPEKERHDQLTRDILNHHQGFRLRDLMSMTDYPRDSARVMWLYAEGYSLSDYLVKRSDHRTFLAFVARGMSTRSWDRACQDYFGLRSVEELEEAWLKHLRDTKRGAPAPVQIAKNTQPQDNGTPKTYRTTTLPPAQPLEPMATFRGAAPNSDQVGKRFADPQTPTTPPIPIPVPANQNWQPGAQSYQAATAQPQYMQQQQQPRYAGPQYAQPQQPYYQQPYNPTVAVPFGYPSPR